MHHKGRSLGGIRRAFDSLMKSHCPCVRNQKGSELRPLVDFRSNRKDMKSIKCSEDRMVGREMCTQMIEATLVKCKNGDERVLIDSLAS